MTTCGCDPRSHLLLGKNSEVYAFPALLGAKVNLGVATLELFGRLIWIGNGQVDYIDPDFASSDDSFYPKEDLLQISFPTTLVLDVGWYPDSDPKGAFNVVVIQNSDWDAPVFSVRARDVPAMLEAISQAVVLIAHPLSQRELPKDE